MCTQVSMEGTINTRRRQCFYCFFSINNSFVIAFPIPFIFIFLSLLSSLSRTLPLSSCHFRI